MLSKTSTSNTSPFTAVEVGLDVAVVVVRVLVCGAELAVVPGLGKGQDLLVVPVLGTVYLVIVVVFSGAFGHVVGMSRCP